MNTATATAKPRVLHLIEEYQPGEPDVWVNLGGLAAPLDPRFTSGMLSDDPEVSYTCSGPLGGFETSQPALSADGYVPTQVPMGRDGFFNSNSAVLDPSHLPDGFYTIASIEWEPCVDEEQMEEGDEPCAHCDNSRGYYGWMLLRLELER